MPGHGGAQLSLPGRGAKAEQGLRETSFRASDFGLCAFKREEKCSPLVPGISPRARRVLQTLKMWQPHPERSADVGPREDQRLVYSRSEQKGEIPCTRGMAAELAADQTLASGKLSARRALNI